MRTNGHLDDHVMVLERVLNAAGNVVPYAPLQNVALPQAELPKIFPAGVCDFSKPGVGQHPPLGTWLDYGGN